MNSTFLVTISNSLLEQIKTALGETEDDLTSLFRKCIVLPEEAEDSGEIEIELAE